LSHDVANHPGALCPARAGRPPDRRRAAVFAARNVDGLKLFSLLGVGGVIELVGGALLLVGLFTRVVAFILSGEMAVAYFGFHALSAFWPIHNKGELAALYCFVFLFFAAAGPGKFAIDRS
jgi:putative oxidoreductase